MSDANHLKSAGNDIILRVNSETYFWHFLLKRHESGQKEEYFFITITWSFIKCSNSCNLKMIILIILCLMLNSMQFSEVGKYLKVKYDRNSVKVRKWTHIKLKPHSHQRRHHQPHNRDHCHNHHIIRKWHRSHISMLSGFRVHSSSSVGPVQKSITESSWISPSKIFQHKY